MQGHPEVAVPRQVQPPPHRLMEDKQGCCPRPGVYGGEMAVGGGQEVGVWTQATDPPHHPADAETSRAQDRYREEVQRV